MPSVAPQEAARLVSIPFAARHSGVPERTFRRRMHAMNDLADGRLLLTLASVRGQTISLEDVGVVLSYVGRSAASPAYGEDNNSDGLPDGQQLDRAPSADPAKPWRSTGPTGGISLQDVGVALAQVGAKTDDFAAIIFAQPGHNDTGVQPTGVGQDDFGNLGSFFFLRHENFSFSG